MQSKRRFQENVSNYEEDIILQSSVLKYIHLMFGSTLKY